MAVFCWSVYNGANYYIEVFGKRFQNELEEMKREVQKWHNTPELTTSPLLTPRTEGGEMLGDGDETKRPGYPRNNSLDKIPLLNDQIGSTGIDGGAKDVAKPRKLGGMPA